MAKGAKEQAQPETARVVVDSTKTTLEPGDLVILHVQGPARGRWRAGFAFGPQPRRVEVTPEQFEAIMADPELKLVPPPAEAAEPKQ